MNTIQGNIYNPPSVSPGVYKVSELVPGEGKAVVLKNRLHGVILKMMRKGSKRDQLFVASSLDVARLFKTNPCIIVPPSKFSFFYAGDIIHLGEDGTVRTLAEGDASEVCLFVTNRCNCNGIICHDLPAQGKLMIAVLPQSAEERILSWDRHWQEIRFICQALKDTAAPTLISLQPRMKRDQYDFVKTEFGLPIAEEPLADFLPAGDIFSSSFSSTIKWAVLCGIPSIIWTWFGVDYDIFDEFPSIMVMKENDQLAQSYQRLLHDDNLFAKMALGQRRRADKFSPFDGKCMDLILKVICAEN